MGEGAIANSASLGEGTINITFSHNTANRDLHYFAPFPFIRDRRVHISTSSRVKTTNSSKFTHLKKLYTIYVFLLLNLVLKIASVMNKILRTARAHTILEATTISNSFTSEFGIFNSDILLEDKMYTCE